MSPAPILVTGATGAQGGATARRLLACGHPVRLLTRDPDKPEARALIGLGAKAMAGDFEDPASVRAAMQGVGGVFSVQLPGPRERAHGFLLIEEAKRAGVAQFVHTSVTESQNHRSFPGWGTGRWTEDYWTAKWDIEERLRNAGFAHHMVLRPAFMMENFIPPKVNSMFPDLRRGEIATAIRPDTVLQLVSAEDVGAFAAAAFEHPEAFDRKSIDLASEAPRLSEIAAQLSQGLRRPIAVLELSPETLLARGQHPGWVSMQEWVNVVGYRAPIAELARYPLRLTGFADWIAGHRSEFQFD